LEELHVAHAVGRNRGHDLGILTLLRVASDEGLSSLEGRGYAGVDGGALVRATRHAAVAGGIACKAAQVVVQLAFAVAAQLEQASHQREQQRTLHQPLRLALPATQSK